MEQFLLTQRDVMDAYLAAPARDRGRGSRPGRCSAPSSPTCPKASSWPSGWWTRRASPTCSITRSVGASRAATPSCTRSPLMPLAMSLEILAEAACCLMPGRVVRGLREVRAHRWIAFDAAPQTLQVSALRVAAENGVEHVQVELRSLEPSGGEPNGREPNGGGPAGGDPAVEATVLLGAELPPAPPARLGRFAVEAPAASDPGGALRDDVPRTAVAGVQSLEAVSPDGVRARLRVQPRGGLLRERPRAGLCARPRAARQRRPAGRVLGGRECSIAGASCSRSG